MTAPTKLVLTYGPITEVVKGSNGFICKKRGEDFITAIIDCGDQIMTRRFPDWDTPAARAWVRG